MAYSIGIRALLVATGPARTMNPVGTCNATHKVECEHDQYSVVERHRPSSGHYKRLASSHQHQLRQDDHLQARREGLLAHLLTQIALRQQGAEAARPRRRSARAAARASAIAHARHAACPAPWRRNPRGSSAPAKTARPSAPRAYFTPPTPFIAVIVGLSVRAHRPASTAALQSELALAQDDGDARSDDDRRARQHRPCRHLVEHGITHAER